MHLRFNSFRPNILLSICILFVLQGCSRALFLPESQPENKRVVSGKETKKKNIGGILSIPQNALLLPKGTFSMGAYSRDLESYDNERPTHKVSFQQTFYIWKTEVTQEQFEALMGYNPSHFKKCGPRCPVEQVHFHEAMAFCNALSKFEKIPACYECQHSKSQVRCKMKDHFTEYQSCKGWRLPTEAEWEYAARGNSIEARYKHLNKVAWYDKVSQKQTHPVGQKVPNDFGLFDTLGNVQEWVMDAAYRKYPLTEKVTISPLHIDRTNRVVRGGAWDKGGWYSRLSNRDSNRPTTGLNNLGFRPVKTK